MKSEMLFLAIIMLMVTYVLGSAAKAKDLSVATEYSITLEMALRAAKTANDHCINNGFAPTTTVVDHRGQMKVQLHSDGGFPHAIETSYRKALTAASRREATAVIEQENEHEPQLGAVFNEIGLITLSGGMPIVYKGQVIGAIGVAGAPGENAKGVEHDDICAQKGIDSLHAFIK